MNTKSEYNSWRAMIARCENPDHPGYKHYGERGIKICARWRLSFKLFLLDMGLKPSPWHTLDRINVELGYSAANCRWATPKEQARNKRRAMLTGQRFGRLVVLREAGTRGGKALWLCQCECGREIKATTGNLRSGNTKGCGHDRRS